MSTPAASSPRPNASSAGEGSRARPRASIALRAASAAALLGVLLYGLALASRGASSPRGAPPSRPNVLLVSIDSLRADHVHAYGYARPTSPVIDALAQGGVLFREAVAPSSWTLPSHMTLLTSMPPDQHGLKHRSRHLAASILTLPAVFRANGYATAGFVSGPYLAHEFGFDQGFELYDDWSVHSMTFDTALTERTSPPLTSAVLAWLDRALRGDDRRPFFLFVHMWDVHFDYAPPRPFDRLFDPTYRGDMNGSVLSNPRYAAQMPSRDLEHVIALYDGEIGVTDGALGKILARLERAGVLDDTIVAVTADHGEEFFEHGYALHGLTLYDELLRVPLVMRYPRRIAPHQVIDSQVRLMDVGPTLLGLAQVPIPPAFGTGSLGHVEYAEQDLTPWLTNGAAPETFPELPAFSQTSYFYGRWFTAVRTPTAKLIRSPTLPTQLFDLAVDPKETQNLAGARPELLASLVALGDAWQAQVERLPSAAVDSDPAAETAARLRSLGYLQ